MLLKVYFPVQLIRVFKREELSSPGASDPFFLGKQAMSSAERWCWVVQLVGAQKLTWQGPTRPLYQLPFSSRFEHLQHEMKQTTAQEESLLQIRLLHQELMCQASEPPLSPIPTNHGIHSVGFLPWLFHYYVWIGPDFFLASAPERLFLCLISISS